MGLTIHWTLKAARATRDQAKAKIEKLRQRALDLPFQSVSDLVEFKSVLVQFKGHLRGKKGSFRADCRSVAGIVNRFTDVAWHRLQFQRRSGLSCYY